MTLKRLKETLNNFKEGEISEEEILSFLNDLPYQDLGFAKVDHHRVLRHGFPEVIFGKGKTPQQIIERKGLQPLTSQPDLYVTFGANQVGQVPTRPQRPQTEVKPSFITPAK